MRVYIVLRTSRPYAVDPKTQVHKVYLDRHSANAEVQKRTSGLAWAKRHVKYWVASKEIEHE
jgi:hypothetical protein